jgi:Ran GTPase-activating protein (RanGAP) involved in mRNA processing and transport
MEYSNEDKRRIVIEQIKKNSDHSLEEINFPDTDFVLKRLSKQCLAEFSSQVYQEALGVFEQNQSVKKVNISMKYVIALLPEDDEKFLLLRSIRSLPCLEHLYVKSCGLSGVALKCITAAISQSTTNLTYLTIESIHYGQLVIDEYGPLSGSNKEHIEFCNSIKSLQNLKSFQLLDVEEEFDLNPLVESLIRLPVLENLEIRSYKLRLNPRMTPGSLELLCTSSTIKSLFLKRLQLDGLLQQFFTGLQSNIVLRVLNLESNQIKCKHGIALSNLILSNNTLQELHLGCNQISNQCVENIVRALSANKESSLKVLDLNTNFLTATSGEHFGDLLSENKCRIASLNLAYNSIFEEGVTKIALGLTTNTSLKMLNLSGTKINDSACASLATALKSNSTLEDVQLTENGLGDQACMDLAEMLKSNVTLKQLNLMGNRMFDTGLISLAQSLEENSRLKNLNVSFSRTTIREYSRVDCEKAFVKMMKKNCTIKYLSLGDGIPFYEYNFYCKLNRLGRGKLLQEMDNEKLWLEAVEKVKEDLPCLFYLIRANPAVVQKFVSVSV